MSDTTSVRDGCAKLKGWTPGTGFDLGQWWNGSTWSITHPIPDTLDAAVAIIEEGGWKWERGAHFDVTKLSAYHPDYDDSNHFVEITETGNLRLDFFTAALAKLKATQEQKRG